MYKLDNSSKKKKPHKLLKLTLYEMDSVNSLKYKKFNSYSKTPLKNLQPQIILLRKSSEHL